MIGRPEYTFFFFPREDIVNEQTQEKNAQHH